MIDLTNMPASDIASGVQRGDLTAVEVAESYLQRIEKFDNEIMAFATVDREVVRAESAGQDHRLASGARLPLHGVPVGVKDIIDVAGLPTIAGFEPYRDRIAQRDADIVGALRSLGAVVLGKTHTTQFAVGDPAPTANPWNLSKSPAGSSAGSGAAVAARMAPITLGSQTAGSMLRPAAFNGVVGLKPTFGWFSLDGVFPLCWSLDHLGVYGATVDDVSLIYRSLTGAQRIPELSAPENPRIALLTEFLDMSDPEVADHTRAVASALETAGARIVETTIPEPFDYLFAVHQVIFAAEMSAVHSANLERYAEYYGPRIRTGVEAGSLIPAAYLLQAQRHRRALTRTFDRFLAGFDAVLLPTVSTEACDRDETGDRRFQIPATLLGAPAISLPTGLSSNALPLGTQLVARRGADEQLLAIARWVSAAAPLVERPDLERVIQSSAKGNQRSLGRAHLQNDSSNL